MADNDPNYRTAGELIREWFQDEARDFKGAQEDLMTTVGEWVLSAYLQGHGDGFTQGEGVGNDEGYEIGHQEGYDEGYHDAQAECDSYD